MTILLSCVSSVAKLSLAQPGTSDLSRTLYPKKEETIIQTAFGQEAGELFLGKMLSEDGQACCEETW